MIFFYTIQNMTDFHRTVERYNKLVSMLIIQTTNDINQFYEIKTGDQYGQELIARKTIMLSQQSEKIITDINNLMDAFYNEFYYPTLQSECLCSVVHTHDDYKKFSAYLNTHILELEIHYLLEPFTRTRLAWYVPSVKGTISEYIIIKIDLRESLFQS